MSAGTRLESHQTVVVDSPGRGDYSLDGTGDVTPSSLQTVTELTRNSHQNVSINLFGVETEVYVETKSTE